MSDPLQSYEKFDGVGPHAETIETRARIGERFLECYESALDDPRLKGFTPADCPSEIISELIEQLDYAGCVIAELRGPQVLPLVDQHGLHFGNRHISFDELHRIEVVTDDDGNVWTPPTAWAYMKVCQTLDRVRYGAPTGEDLRDALSDIIHPIHWETWKAALFSDHREGWPDDDEQEAITRRVDSMAVGEHWDAWGREILDQVIKLIEEIRAGRSPASPQEVTMDRYIGTKQLTARPLALGAYNEHRGWTIPADEDPARPGYLVQYEDGYQSWSPTEVFETAYNRLDGMTFGHAVELMKEGRRVARAGWNGKGMFAYYVPAASYPVQTGAAMAHFGEGSIVPYRAYLALKTVDDDVATWAPSVSDVLAVDWQVVE